MKVRYIGEYYKTSLLKGKIYEVIRIEKDWYRIIDEDCADDDDEYPGYLFPPEEFEIVEF